MLVQALVVVGVLVAAALDAPFSSWDPALLGLLAAFAVVSDLTGVETGSSKLKVSGSFLAIVVAMVLLGGAPASVVGATTIVVGWLRWREAGHYFRNNLVTYAVFPFVAGTAFHSAVEGLALSPRDGAFYLLIFAAFSLALLLNFAGVAGYQCLLEGTSLRRKAGALAPLIVSEFGSALLCAGTVFFFNQAGIAAVAMIGVVIVVFQYLVGQLLVSRERGERLRERAVTDPLTGLANRWLLIERLEEAVGASRPHGVMLMDLDGFKEVNDALGHHFGDRLLVALAERLPNLLPEGGLLARLGGDEFAVLVEGDDPRALLGLAGELLEGLQQPVQIDDMTLEVSASIGIVRHPHDGSDAETLLRRADVAMYTAKQSGATSEFYSPQRDAHSPRRLRLLADLRRGLRQGELFLEYQPEINLTRSGVRAAEALVRWQHPTLGRLPPSEFVELAERTGLVKPMTEEIFDIAFAQVVDWRRQGLDIRVALNLSARSLADRGLADQIAAQVANAGLTADCIALEITETMVLQDPKRALATLRQLRALGLELAIDDFGTGYSSLAYLKRLPVSEIKVDRSFVSTMATDPVDAVIVRSTIELAHSLGLRAVAEGVEDETTLTRLAMLGCDLAQGFHLSGPLPAPELYDWATRNADRIWAEPGQNLETEPRGPIASPPFVPEMSLTSAPPRRRLTSGQA